MTAVAAGPDTHSDHYYVSFARVCRSEWTKLRSVRSTWWALLAAVVMVFGIGAYSSIHQAATEERRYHVTDPVELAANMQVGAYLGVLVVVVLAALFMTSEYGTGSIRSSLTAVPRRTTVMLAKATVLASVTAVSTGTAAVLTFLVGSWAWSSHDYVGPSLADPGVPAVVLGIPLYLSLAAVFALALGTVVRNTAVTLTVIVGLFFIVSTLLGGWEYGGYLPSNAGAAMSHLTLGSELLSGGTGMLVLAGYAAVLSAVAVWRLRRSDV